MLILLSWLCLIQLLLIYFGLDSCHLTARSATGAVKVSVSGWWVASWWEEVSILLSVDHGGIWLLWSAQPGYFTGVPEAESDGAERNVGEPVQSMGHPLCTLPAAPLLLLVLKETLLILLLGSPNCVSSWIPFLLLLVFLALRLSCTASNVKGV